MENDNNRYANGKIYCLRSHKTDNIYIGSTTQPLYKRLWKHKGDKKNELANYDDVYIELIEEYPCKNKMELNRKEGEHIRANDCVNKIIAGRTRKEYYDDNRNEILEQKKQYRLDNVDEVLEQDKNNYIANKDKIRERQKQYHIDNRDKILERKKQLYLSKKQSTSSLT
jgi:hypothetical protein